MTNKQLKNLKDTLWTKAFGAVARSNQPDQKILHEPSVGMDSDVITMLHLERR